MDEYKPRCPKCGKLETEVVSVHDPATWDLNTRATLRCASCGIQWEGLVKSPRYEEARQKGWVQ